MDKKPTYDELAAHVERLREAMHYVLQAWNYEGVLAEHGSIFQEADNRLTETPAQSLNHIKAQVEEETIDTCKEYWDELENVPRKYKEQSNED